MFCLKKNTILIKPILMKEGTIPLWCKLIQIIMVTSDMINQHNFASFKWRLSNRTCDEEF